MQDGEIQQELLKQARKHKKALELAIKIEMGIQNKLNISGTSAYTVSNQLNNTATSNIKTLWTNPRTVINNFKPTSCPKSGYT